MYRKETTMKGTPVNPFEAVHDEISIIVSGAARDPLDRASTTKNIIPAGTPLAPVSGKYLPIRRTARSSTTNDNITSFIAVNATPFEVGDAIHFFATKAGTASAVRTITAINYTTGVIDVDAAFTLAAGDLWVEAHLTGLHEDASASPTGIPDCIILAKDITNAHADGVTYDVAASGVIAGRIRVAKLNGPGTATFDSFLETQLPGVVFVTQQPGSVITP